MLRDLLKKLMVAQLAKKMDPKDALLCPRNPVILPIVSELNPAQTFMS
jgi:hypothetical protein